LARDDRFSTIRFHESSSTTIPFRKLKVKIKKEIITFCDKTKHQQKERAPSIAPTVLKQWLDDKKDITLLDTRNHYEIEFGTFANAINPNIAHFSELREKLSTLDPQKPVIMFCTGGIRCEKSTHYAQSLGFKEVYQLDGGILGYFKEVGQEHWVGSCFVFDERIAVNAKLASVYP
jgi:UPF0176 protein